MGLIIGINEKRCTSCRKCVLDCPEALFLYDDTEKFVSYADPLARCIACGHCIAVCPEDAVRYSAKEAPLDHPLLATPSKILGTEELKLFLRARRSIRHFEDRAIPEELLDRILEAMRYAPTGSNREKIHYTVISSQEHIRFLSARVMGLFKKINILLTFLRCIIPFGRHRKGGALSNGLFTSLKNALERAARGEDPIFYHAPCLVIVSAPRYFKQSGVDTGIALTHGMLAAQAVGLGTCLIGFAHETLLRSRSLRKYFKIPSPHRPEGVMALGFPAVSYVRAPMRKPLSVTRM